MTLEDFHFGVEFFGDSVVAGEAPHSGDFFAPGMEHIAELDQWREPATTERADLFRRRVVGPPCHLGS